MMKKRRLGKAIGKIGLLTGLILGTNAQAETRFEVGYTSKGHLNDVAGSYETGNRPFLPLSDTEYIDIVNTITTRPISALQKYSDLTEDRKIDIFRLIGDRLVSNYNDARADRNDEKLFDYTSENNVRPEKVWAGMQARIPTGICRDIAQTIEKAIKTMGVPAVSISTITPNIGHTIAAFYTPTKGVAAMDYGTFLAPSKKAKDLETIAAWVQYAEGVFSMEHQVYEDNDLRFSFKSHEGELIEDFIDNGENFSEIILEPHYKLFDAKGIIQANRTFPEFEVRVNNYRQSARISLKEILPKDVWGWYETKDGNVAGIEIGSIRGGQGSPLKQGGLVSLHLIEGHQDFGGFKGEANFVYTLGLFNEGNKEKDFTSMMNDVRINTMLIGSDKIAKNHCLEYGGGGRLIVSTFGLDTHGKRDKNGVGAFARFGYGYTGFDGFDIGTYAATNADVTEVELSSGRKGIFIPKTKFGLKSRIDYGKGNIFVDVGYLLKPEQRGITGEVGVQLDDKVISVDASHLESRISDFVPITTSLGVKVDVDKYQFKLDYELEDATNGKGNDTIKGTFGFSF